MCEFSGDVSNVQPGCSSHSRGSIMKCNLAGSNLVSAESMLPLWGGWSILFNHLNMHCSAGLTCKRCFIMPCQSCILFCCSDDILSCTCWGNIACKYLWCDSTHSRLNSWASIRCLMLARDIQTLYSDLLPALYKCCISCFLTALMRVSYVVDCTLAPWPGPIWVIVHTVLNSTCCSDCWSYAVLMLSHGHRLMLQYTNLAYAVFVFTQVLSCCREIMSSLVIHLRGFSTSLSLWFTCIVANLCVGIISSEELRTLW
jgi:hypothetical protein